MTDQVSIEMEKVSPYWRCRWCEAEICACMGCVNRSGGANITKQDWIEWVNNNPKTNLPNTDHEFETWRIK